MLRERVKGGRVQEIGHRRHSKSGGIRWGTQKKKGQDTRGRNTGDRTEREDISKQITGGRR